MLSSAYCAGLYDGGGWLCIHGDSVGRISLKAGIRLVKGDVLRDIHAQFGGGIYNEPRKTSRDIIGWCIQQPDELRRFLDAIKPFVVVKRDYVELGLLWLSVATKSGYHLTPE